MSQNKLVIGGREIDNDFIKEYELYKETIASSLYGQLYKVYIELSDEGIQAGKMEELMAEPASMQLDERNITVIWEIPDYEGIHEIENALYYLLNDGEYGTYDWVCLRLSSDMVE